MGAFFLVVVGNKFDKPNLNFPLFHSKDFILSENELRTESLLVGMYRRVDANKL